jgi:hypothetical protein
MLTPRLRGYIYETSFSLYITNGPNKLECYIIYVWKGLKGTNNLAYWANL